MVGVASASPLAGALPDWVTLLRAPNPGIMTLDGTNTWVLRAAGEEFAVVIDPGPADEGHLGAIADHGPVAFILITHGHPDHVEGAARLSELLGGVNVLAADPAHCVGGEPLDRTGGNALGGSASVGPLGRGESLGGAGFEIRVVDTPGHTADSVCFEVEHAGRRVVFTGDTILGRGTTVVAWPDGDLGDYLASLRVLTAYQGALGLPGHGPVLADCAAAARAYLDHRLARLEQVRAALAAGDRTPAEVVARVYAQVDRALWPAAEWSVRAQLAYLAGGTSPRESGPGTPELDPL